MATYLFLMPMETWWRASITGVIPILGRDPGMTNFPVRLGQTIILKCRSGKSPREVMGTGLVWGALKPVRVS